MPRRSYRHDPTLGDRVFELLEIVWRGLGLAHARGVAAAFGASWESASTPFVHEENGRVLSHVGLLELSLVVKDRAVRVGGVHGVATHPAHRRRGLYRGLLEELLGYTATRYETLLLTTAHPEYFAPFGFLPVQEHVFVAGAPRVRAASTARRLDPTASADAVLLHRLIDRRASLSSLLGLGPEKAVWAFNEAASDIRFAPDLDVAIVAERIGPLLRLFDVIGSRAPSLADIVAAWGEPVARVVAFFNPDRLDDGFVPEPHCLAGGEHSLDPGGDNTVLMARGPLVCEGAAAMLARAARC
jgi:predicted N-acetyltransferase YhbS